jgi:hypothetical protein
MIKQHTKTIDQDTEANGRRHRHRTTSVGTSTAHATDKRTSLRIADLEWSQEETIETRSRLSPFEEEWSTPDMDVYDDL